MFQTLRFQASTYNVYVNQKINDLKYFIILLILCRKCRLHLTGTHHRFIIDYLQQSDSSDMISLHSTNIDLSLYLLWVAEVRID